MPCHVLLVHIAFYGILGVACWIREGKSYDENFLACAFVPALLPAGVCMSVDSTSLTRASNCDEMDGFFTMSSGGSMLTMYPAI